MRRILLLFAVMLASCGVQHIVPVEHIIYRDSTVVNTVDSVVYIPKERIVDIVPDYDTLRMETDMAKATAFVDTTTHSLKGSLENKSGVKYKYLYKDKIFYKDSIITKEIPIEVEKPVRYIPKLFIISFVFSCLILAAGIIYIFWKFGFRK